MLLGRLTLIEFSRSNSSGSLLTPLYGYNGISSTISHEDGFIGLTASRGSAEGRCKYVDKAEADVTGSRGCSVA